MFYCLILISLVLHLNNQTLKPDLRLNLCIYKLKATVINGLHYISISVCCVSWLLSWCFGSTVQTDQSAASPH